MTIFWRIAHRLYKTAHLKKLARLFEFLNYWICSNAVSASASIGKGTQFWHRGLGCVVHFNAEIGENCKIFPNVMIGASGYNGKIDVDAPKIGNNVFIGTGAIILGGIHIGDNAIIGANAVVLHDVHENTKVVGVPAREI